MYERRKNNTENSRAPTSEKIWQYRATYSVTRVWNLPFGSQSIRP